MNAIDKIEINIESLMRAREFLKNANISTKEIDRDIKKIKKRVIDLLKESEEEKIEELKKNNQCPRCKSFNTIREPLKYDDGTFSEDTENCCKDCGWGYLLV
jgi:ribosomal protein S27AE